MYAPPPNSQGFSSPVPAPGAGFSNDPIPRAWRLVIDQPWPWVAAAVLSIIVSSGFNGTEKALERAGIESFPISFAISLLNICLSLVLNAGITRMALHHIRTGVADFNQIFTLSGEVVLPILGAGILTSLLIFAGTIFCVVPGLFLLAMFTFVMPLIVDRRVPAMESIGLSFRALNPHAFAAMFFYIRLCIVLLAGVLALCVGLVIAIPVVSVSLTILYCDFFPQASINQPMASMNVPPISDPGV